MSQYKTVSTQQFKTHFASLVRDIALNDTLEGIKVMNHGRMLGIFVPLKQKKKTET